MSILDSQPAIVPSTFNAAFFESHCVKQWTFPYFVDWKNEDHDKISSLLHEFSNSLDSLLTKNPQLHREVRQYVHQLKKTKLPETAAKQSVAEHLQDKKHITNNHIAQNYVSGTLNYGTIVNKSEAMPSSSSQARTDLIKRKAAGQLEESLRPRPQAPTLPRPQAPTLPPDHAVTRALLSLNEVPLIIRDTNINIGLPTSSWMIGNLDITQKWNSFMKKCVDNAKNGLDTVTQLQQILALSHMLLIKPEQHDSLAVECFGEVVLEHIHRSLVNHYVDSAIDVTTDTVPLMQSTLKTLQRGSVTRQQALDNVLKAILDRDMDDNDRVILDIFTNCIKNLPKRPLLNTISELELCATYIDPVLRPIFHDPDNKRIFRWFDHKTLDHERTGSSRRPDSIVCLVEQSMVTATNGFGEVKVKGSKKQDLAVDLTRLGIFAKDALDIHDLDCCICFQAFGGHLTFYLATLHADGAYVFFEVGKFEVPFSLEDVPGLIANVDAILEVRHVYKKWCNKKAAASHPANHDFSRPTLRSPHFDELVHYHPPSSRTPHYTF